MVTTRAQARRERGSDSDNDSAASSNDVHEVSSGTEERTPHRGAWNATRSSNGRAVTAAMSGRDNVSPPGGEGEKLGRGCRVTRSSISLDEQYLAASLYRANAQQRGQRGAGRPTHDHRARYPGGRGTAAHVEAFTINQRYPMREAARRAIENLHVTLTSANGAAAIGLDTDADENSNSMGTFHFRNHPELAEEIQKHHQTQRRRRRRHRHGGRRGDSSSSSSSTSSGSDAEDGSEDGRSGSSSDTAASENGTDRKAAQQRAKPAAGQTVSAAAAARYQGSNASSSPRVSGGGREGGDFTRSMARRTTGATHISHNDDAVSLDSSITEASMRDESVEKSVIMDRHANSAGLMSSSSSENGDGTRDFDDEAERRRALRHARESVDQNVNINYYMPDAVGAADAQKIRRRQLDRRYRWLTHQEEEARINGGTVGGGGEGGGAVTTANGALGDILPLRIDDDVTFASVGGLPEHIVALREMVLLPLLYPDLFERLDLRPPRGVLFVGPPGTGKTLMARALANEGSRFACGGRGGESTSLSARHAPPSPQQQQQQRITFFVRKGADMLSKWVGESERQLKLLFEEAKRLQPSIIFFDEVDGLAPTRHAKTEQTQAALVSTLLALMDGLEDRGRVVVIGATNRPDTLDPALRRPGRFDRELVFPLPDAAARRHILTIQLAKKAMPDSPEQRTALLNDLTEMTEGYSGADLGALCTEASLHRLRTALPQLYLSSTRLIVPRELEKTRLHVRTEDFYAAAQRMQPSLRRCRSARHVESYFLDAYVEVLVRGTRDATLAALAPSWSLVDKVLRASTRDCQDMATAVQRLCTVPIPQPPRPCLLVLYEAPPLPPPPQQQQQPVAPSSDAAGQQEPQHQQQQRRALQLHHLSISLLKGLPGLHQITVSLPELVWEGDGSTGAAALWASRGFAPYPGAGGDEGGILDGYLGGTTGLGIGGGDSFTHMSQVVQSVRQCSPCVVYLSGAEEWLTGLRCPDDNDDDDSASNDSSPRRLDQETHKRVEERGDECSATAACFSTSRQQRQVQLFRYYMNMLADTDVIFLLPCTTAATRALLFGPSLETGNSRSDDTKAFPDTPASLIGRSVASSELFSISSSASPSSPMLMADPPTAVHLARMPARRQLLHPQFSIVHAGIAAKPLPADLRRFVEYVYRVVTMTLLLHHSGSISAHNGIDEEGGASDEASAAATAGVNQSVSVLREDHAPLPSPVAAAQLRACRRADRARRCELWRKVEYRRLQLRHVLMKWVSQYINSGKFKLLASADLDLAPDDPLHKAWRQHTKHRRIGLQDILENIEDEKYVCLSQYHDDVDQLVRNVRSFFRTRAAQDQRYRLKALDLKETCLLNMYKMNRQVIRFCEQTREVQEPSSTDSDNDGDGDHRRREEGEQWQRRRHTHMRSCPDTVAETSLVRKEDDPALIAERSRRAVSFSQRPAAAAPRKRRRSGWMYGDGRRRRRRRQPAPTATRPSHKAAASVEEEEDSEGEDGSVKGEEAVEFRVHTDGSSHSDEDNGGDEVTHDPPRSGVGAHALEAAASAKDSVEGWACDLLSTFTYTQLYSLFKSVMRGLEVEVRALDDAGGQQPSPATSLGVGAVTNAEVKRAESAAATAENSAALDAREVYVELIFKRLLLAAVVQ
jgi:DNA polymerase III delta prime subunit